jgi:nitroreductase
MDRLGLSVDEVLTTTRAVRKRLDLTRPVPDEVLLECLEIALQAPSASNSQLWQWVLVTDPAKREALAELYRRGWAIYADLPIAIGNIYQGDDAEVRASYERSASSAQYLADHLGEVPAFLIPCVPGSREERPDWGLASMMMGSITQASWSFMLAARERGLGTCWTTIHLMFEEEAAAILGIPYDQIVQVALIPIAYTKGTEFRPGARQPLETVLHRDSW